MGLVNRAAGRVGLSSLGKEGGAGGLGEGCVADGLGEGGGAGCLV